MEDKLKSVYKFLEDNNLRETLDLLQREIGSTKSVTPNPQPFDMKSTVTR